MKDGDILLKQNGMRLLAWEQGSDTDSGGHWQPAQACPTPSSRGQNSYWEEVGQTMG